MDFFGGIVSPKYTTAETCRPDTIRFKFCPTCMLLNKNSLSCFYRGHYIINLNNSLLYTLKKENFPQNYHTFASNVIPPNRWHLMTPGFFKVVSEGSKNSWRCLSELLKSVDQTWISSFLSTRKNEDGKLRNDTRGYMGRGSIYSRCFQQ